MMRSLSKQILYSIIQNSKRLRTFQRPQETDIIPIKKEIFEQAVLLKLIRIRDGFQQLAEKNTSGKVRVELSGLSRLQVVTDGGNFLIEGDSELSTLFYTSPSTGTYKYYYDVQQERFISNKDEHLLDENLTREAHRHFGDILSL